MIVRPSIVFDKFIDKLSEVLVSQDGFKFGFAHIVTHDYLGHVIKNKIDEKVINNWILHRFSNIPVEPYTYRQQGHPYRYINQFSIWSNFYFLSNTRDINRSQRNSIDMSEILYETIEEEFFDYIFVNDDERIVYGSSKSVTMSNRILDLYVSGSIPSTCYCCFYTVRTNFQMKEYLKSCLSGNRPPVPVVDFEVKEL